MKRNIRHIRARNGEWIQVHRDPPPSKSGEDWPVMLLLKVGGGMLLFFLACEMIKALMPFIGLGLLGWVGLQIFAKGGKR